MKKIIQKVFGRENFLRLTLPIILVIALIIIGLFSFQKPKTKTLTVADATTRAETFVNKYLMQSGTKATIKSITEEYGLYKLNIDIVSSVVTSYMTKDGKLFFPQAMDIDQVSNSAANSTPSNGTQASATVTSKNSKPTIELFVMSYCPYGTQIEKGILPALAALGNKVNFELKFVDYSMHGQKELTENLTQYCIRKNEPQKLSAYLTCFLQASDSASCVTSTGLNKSNLTSCVAASDSQYKVTENSNNKVNYQGTYPSFPIDQADNTKYNVAGSPTLVINGQQIESSRDSASLLKTICSAFTTQPKECQTSLSSAAPAPGFGSGTAASGSAAAGCGQ
jgi:lipopolysaccharide export system protein LptC